MKIFFTITEKANDFISNNTQQKRHDFVSTVEFGQVNICWGYALFQHRHVLQNDRKHGNKWNNICIFEPENLSPTT